MPWVQNSSPSRAFFDPARLRARLVELTPLINDDGLWSDPERAKSISREYANKRETLTKFETLTGEVNDLGELLELYISEGQSGAEIEPDLVNLERRITRWEVECMFSGEFDDHNAFLHINSGAGGTESNDWASMLLRMYMRWAERNKFSVELLEKVEGEDTGIKSTTLKISGTRVYGWLKHENGVHRLVRISPFDANKKRHTSFASILAYPVVDKNIDIEILEKDIRVDTYRASGAGGQHVNKTDSAVRVTHIPTGIVVASQNARSQHANREEVMKRLKSILFQLELEKKEKSVTDTHEKTAIGFGHAIRSYVLHPYKMVNDTRTGMKIGNADGVLDGDLEDLMIAHILHKVTQTPK